MTKQNKPFKRKNLLMKWVVSFINVFLMILVTWTCRPLSLIHPKKLKKNFKSFLHFNKYKSTTHLSIKKYPILIFQKSIKNILDLISIYLQWLKALKFGKNSSNMSKIHMLKPTINMILKSKKFMNSKKNKWRSLTKNKLVIF